MKSGLNLFITFLVVLVTHSISKGANADRIVDSLIRIPKPFFIINVTSTDCISCRGAASKTIEVLKKYVASDMIVLLSDDKMMGIYFSKYPEMYGNFKSYFNQELSKALTTDAKSKLCLVEENGITIFPIPLDETKIKEISKRLHLQPTTTENTKLISSVSNFHIKDSIFKIDNAFFEAKNGTYLLYSDQYQIGLISSRGESKYLEPKIEDSSITFLYNVLSKYVSDNFLSDSESRQALLPLTMPAVFIKSFRFTSDKCYVLFKLNTVFEQPRIKETERRVAVFGRFFFGEIPLNNIFNQDLLDISQCHAYSWLDTTNYGDDLYMPLVDKGFEINGDTLYLPVIRTDNKGNHINDLEINVAKYKFNPNKKLVFTGVSQNHNVNKPKSYSIRKDQEGKPIILNKEAKSIIFTNNKSEEVYLNKYIKESDSLSFIFDIVTNNEKIIFIGSNLRNENVRGVFDRSTKKIEIEKLDDMSLVSDVVILNNFLYTYRKEDNENLIIFSEHNLLSTIKN